MEILKQTNDTTFLAEEDNTVYVLKRISQEDLKTFRILMTLNNRHLVKIQRILTLDGCIFAVCEYITGETLECFVERNGVLSDEETERYLTDLCDGLRAVHTCGIVHRDISPKNVLIHEGRAVLIDFGISRTVKSGQSSDTQVLGTQGYAAPEQFGFSQTSPRADIYALGVLVNYMKTGHIPSEQKEKGYFGKVIEKCIEMDERNRYDNTDLLVADLHKHKRMHCFLLNIPGFRTGNLFHMAAAIGYAAFLALIYAVSISTDIREHTVSYLAFDMLFVTFVFGIPPMLLTNVGRWLDRWSLTRNRSKGERLLAVALACGVSVIIGCMFTTGMK
ncbi:MAG TPA: hypothetical protein DDY98_00300 [Ruminococcaceae bacterium]|nr:hypothetical protein [Oscillospiraceae bacterium]